ncbi:MAG: hypothetical protein ACYDCO_01935 [Armatimonadota bacterium]
MQHANPLTDRQISTLRRRETRRECLCGAVLAIVAVTLFTAWLLQFVQPVGR